jgi:hypothetical protein
LLRHQLTVLQRSVTRPRVTRFARAPRSLGPSAPDWPRVQIPEQTMRKYTVGSHLCAPALPQGRPWPRATRGRLRPPCWTSTRTFVASLMRPASAPSATAGGIDVSPDRERQTERARHAGVIDARRRRGDLRCTTRPAFSASPPSVSTAFHDECARVLPCPRGWLR